MIDKVIARRGYPVYVQADCVGAVTSGGYAPFLEKAIGLAYLPLEHAAVGTEFDVEVRGRRCRARVVALPFYRRGAR